jgi:integrase
VKEFSDTKAEAYVLSPRVAREERFQQLRALRKSKVQPSQVCRRKANPQKVPGERYTVYSYRQAIRKACHRAKVPVWHPHQLRHNAATNLREEYGIEMARIILGQKHPSATEISAQADKEQAVAVIVKIG